jgi:hypothetical protein
MRIQNTHSAFDSRVNCGVGLVHMTLAGKKLGLLVSVAPQAPGFGHAVSLAGAALARGVDVYLYCLDEAVLGVGDTRLQAMRSRGLKLYACAYGAQKHGVSVNEDAVFAGLTVVSDLMAGTDRFLSFH